MSDTPKNSFDQLKVLIEKELDIDICEIEARLFLERNNYYRFRGYFSDLLFFDKDSRQEKFISGTKFSYLRDLYLCDSEMRLSISRIVESVELFLKSIYALYLSNSLNDAYFFYKNIHFFEKNGYYKIDLVRNSLNEYVTKNPKSPIIKRYTNIETNLCTMPIWALVEFLSFGDISILYECTLRIHIEKLNEEFLLFNNSAISQLISWIRSTCKLRNTCHHYDRLYKNKFLETPPAITKNKEINSDFFIDSSRQQTLFYNILVSAMICPSTKIIETSINHFKELQLRYNTINFQESYGFPDNWELVLTKYSSYYVNEI